MTIHTKLYLFSFLQFYLFSLWLKLFNNMIVTKKSWLMFSRIAISASCCSSSQLPNQNYFSQIRVQCLMLMWRLWACTSIWHQQTPHFWMVKYHGKVEGRRSLNPCKCWLRLWQLLPLLSLMFTHPHVGDYFLLMFSFKLDFIEVFVVACANLLTFALFNWRCICSCLQM